MIRCHTDFQEGSQKLFPGIHVIILTQNPEKWKIKRDVTLLICAAIPTKIPPNLNVFLDIFRSVRPFQAMVIFEHLSIYTGRRQRGQKLCRPGELVDIQSSALKLSMLSWIAKREYGNFAKYIFIVLLVFIFSFPQQKLHFVYSPPTVKLKELGFN